MNVTIVGGGFGGVKTALELAKHRHHNITLISDRTDFQYYPALYSTATGHNHRESWTPLNEIFKGHPNVELVKDTIMTIDPKRQIITGKSRKAYVYEELVLALGSVTTYFGIEGLDTYAYGIKSEGEIRKLQQHLFDEMKDGRDDEKRYVIIGAGPTGVELAGAMGEYIRLLRKHFGIRKKRVSISLIEAAPRVLPRLSQASSRRALKRLKKLGVHVETNKKVEKATATELIVKGRALETQTVIWTSGVTNAPFYRANQRHFNLDKRGHILVDAHMRAFDHVYVIGDNAATPYAGLAQTALHDALYVCGQLNGKTKAYKPVQPPCVIPIGNNWAIFEWHGLRFGGFVGGLLRQAADIIGYHDVLPLGWAIGAWRASKQRELRLPNKLD